MINLTSFSNRGISLPKMQTKKMMATTSLMTALMVFHVCLSDWLVLSSDSVSPNTSQPSGLQAEVAWLLCEFQGRVARQRSSRFTANVSKSPPVSCNSAQMHCRPRLGDNFCSATRLMGTVTVLISVPWSPFGTQQVQPCRKVGLEQCRTNPALAFV